MGKALIFPSANGTAWSQPTYQSWRRRAFKRALDGAGLEHARPYDLRHSFASLLLHEGRPVIYVARQLGHDARLTLSSYGHVMDEFEDAPTAGREHRHRRRDNQIWIAPRRSPVRVRLAPSPREASHVFGAFLWADLAERHPPELLARGIRRVTAPLKSGARLAGSVTVHPAASSSGSVDVGVWGAPANSVAVPGSYVNPGCTLRP